MSQNMSAFDVLAVPSEPTRQTACLFFMSVWMRKSERVESIVGTSRFEKSSLSPSGYVHAGGRHSCHVDFSSTMYS